MHYPSLLQDKEKRRGLLTDQYNRKQKAPKQGTEHSLFCLKFHESSNYAIYKELGFF